MCSFCVHWRMTKMTKILDFQSDVLGLCLYVRFVCLLWLNINEEKFYSI